MDGNYIFDQDDIKFRRKKTSVWAILRKVFVFIIATASMAVLYYVIFALFFSSEEQKILREENKMYERELPLLEEKEQLIADVVEGLRLKDDHIYEEIFHTSAPNVDPLTDIDLLAGMDSIPDSDIVIYADKKINLAAAAAGRIEENFARIMGVLQDSAFVMPPMTNPLENFSFAQSGASVGNRINPFYKVSIQHNGWDIIAPAGEPVYAAADGVVKNVIRSRKGLGNVVEIDHGNGYITRYAHLADVEVRKGRTLKRGTRIGYVGVSGNSFAPHLHYEVMRDTLVMDPVNYLFASVTPEEYTNILVMSVTTGQSMD